MLKECFGSQIHDTVLTEYLPEVTSKSVSTKGLWWLGLRKRLPLHYRKNTHNYLHVIFNNKNKPHCMKNIISERYSSFLMYY